MAKVKSIRRDVKKARVVLAQSIRKLRLIECVILIVQRALREENTPESVSAAEVLQIHASHPLSIEIDALADLAPASC